MSEDSVSELYKQYAVDMRRSFWSAFRLEFFRGMAFVLGVLFTVALLLGLRLMVVK